MKNLRPVDCCANCEHYVWHGVSRVCDIDMEPIFTTCGQYYVRPPWHICDDYERKESE